MATHLTLEESRALKCMTYGCANFRYGYGPLCRTHCDERTEMHRRRSEKMIATRRQRYPERFISPENGHNLWQAAAHSYVTKAVKYGLLPALSSGIYSCADCGGTADRYDHRDYSRPLDVEPVCAGCNTVRGCARVPVAADYSFKTNRKHD